jgi:hypothetical protein
MLQIPKAKTRSQVSKARYQKPGMLQILFVSFQKLTWMKGSMNVRIGFWRLTCDHTSAEKVGCNLVNSLCFLFRVYVS